jgi:conjugative relaxase-like TrwC/TraI family protein
MMTIRALTRAAAHHIYLEKEAPGHWVGTGAERLGLTGEVTPETFKAVRLGAHPETGEVLRVRKVSDRIYHKPWGTEIYKFREMYDLTISAPKSASVLTLFDDRIPAAHEQAVEKTWRAMEHRCGAMVIASYQHESSRTLDPQTHTHLVAGNLAHDGSKWRTLHANEWYRRQEQITVHYRERLFEKLEGYGYRIQYPEVAGVSPEIMARFSQRSQELNREIEKFTELNRVAPTTREVSIIVRNHRPAKIYLPKEEIRDRQLARLTPSERIQLTDVHQQAREREYVRYRDVTPAKEQERPAEKIRPSHPLIDHVESEPGLVVRPWSYGDAWG